jgi:protein-S-isoprenylcysteine O-methyltransferase Ste14
MEGFDWFVVGFLILATLERTYERRFSRQAVRGERKMAWSYVALHSALILIYMASAIEHFGLKRPVQWGVAAFGLALFVSAVTIRLTAIRALGKFWSLHLEIRDGHQLVTGGIYHHVRHPAYAAIMLEVTAVPLVTNAFATLILALLVYIPLLLLRWYREEQEMVGKFGEQYKKYREEVPAFLPLRWRSRESGVRGR